MGTIHIDYVFMTIKSKKLRIVVGNKKGIDSIVYTYSLDANTEEDNYYSYTAYLNALTEAEGKELQKLIEEKQTRKAHNFLLKTMKQEKCLGPCGPVEMSDRIPDEWFDGCKWALDMLAYPRIVGVYPVDFEVEEFK